MSDPDRRAKATFALDQLDAAVDELAHWMETGERIDCTRCGRSVPAHASGRPVRHSCPGDPS